ncbi:MAG: hypothetical protein ACI9MR_004685, partial [Myxococcota bacterium]
MAIGATVAVTYMVFHYASGQVVSNRLFGSPKSEDSVRTQAAFWRRRLGFLLLGGVPLLVLWLAGLGTPAQYGGLVPDPLMTVLFGLGAWAITVPGILLGAKQPWFAKAYPEVRYANWTTRRLVANGLSWGVYLLGYEFFFRGFLLFGLL